MIVDYTYRDRKKSRQFLDYIYVYNNHIEVYNNCILISNFLFLIILLLSRSRALLRKIICFALGEVNTFEEKIFG